ncbi:MAG: hypothetical protein K940chlam8_01295 [Chlamydiae bacterium]|nr:hypothetical protein [Chlamydiota bacterium]
MINSIKGCAAAYIQIGEERFGWVTAKAARFVAGNGDNKTYKAQLSAEAALFAFVNAVEAIGNALIARACYVVQREDLGEAKAKVSLHQLLLVKDYAEFILTNKKNRKLKEIASKLFCVGIYNTAFYSNLKTGKGMLDLKVAAKEFEQTEDLGTVLKTLGFAAKTLFHAAKTITADAAVGITCTHLS